MITCCAVSSSGEVMAFGGSGGYAHIWAARRDAHVNAMSQLLPPPAPRAPPRATLAEQDSFAHAPQFPLSEVLALGLAFTEHTSAGIQPGSWEQG